MNRFAKQTVSLLEAMGYSGTMDRASFIRSVAGEVNFPGGLDWLLYIW